MRLSEWIRRIGTAEAARRLGVSRHTAWRWRTRGSRPDLARLREIASATRGAVTIEEIVAEYYPEARARR